MKFEGVLSGVITAFNKDETINLSTLREQVEFAIEKCTSNGLMVAAAELQEAVRMSREEKMQCVKTVVDAANGRLPVIAGATDTSTYGSIQLAKFAKDVGADAVMVMPPFGVISRAVLAPLTEQDVVEFFIQLSEAVDIPILVYNNSPTSSARLSLQSLRRILEQENVVGIEENSMDYRTLYLDCREFAGSMSILVRSHVFLPALELGAHGAIIPVGFSKIGSELYNAFKAGDNKKMRECQNMLLDIFPEEFSNKPTISYYKEALTQLGFDVGLPRAPMVALNEDEKLKVSDFLKRLGLAKMKG
jgi:4-hydroxy-tetrahydrodipicolinate synthase